MRQDYHQQITTQALTGQFSARALQIVLAGNVGQDNWRGQVGHPEYHFDDSCFTGGREYMARQRQAIHQSLAENQPELAWQAFGRLTHAAQDFYAHSNYVRLWAGRYIPGVEQVGADLAGQAERLPPPSAIEPLDPELVADPRLVSGRIYYPWEILAYIPGLQKLAFRLLPRDSHTWMNLDTPGSGPLFAYAVAAAEKRTRLEWENLVAEMDPVSRRLFSDLDSAADRGQYAA